MGRNMIFSRCGMINFDYVLSTMDTIEPEKTPYYTPTTSPVSKYLGGRSDFWIQAGSKKDNGMYLFFDAIDTKSLGIMNLDVTTQKSAKESLKRVEDALAKVSANRSQIGAQQNRLEATIRNEDNIVENTQAAESRIRDTDMADEMVKLTKENILAQVGEAMISQANQSNQGVLTLLGS